MVLPQACTPAVCCDSLWSDSVQGTLRAWPPHVPPCCWTGSLACLSGSLLPQVWPLQGDAWLKSPPSSSTRQAPHFSSRHRGVLSETPPPFASSPSYFLTRPLCSRWAGSLRVPQMRQPMATLTIVAFLLSGPLPWVPPSPLPLAPPSAGGCPLTLAGSPALRSSSSLDPCRTPASHRPAGFTYPTAFPGPYLSVYP